MLWPFFSNLNRFQTSRCIALDGKLHDQMQDQFALVPSIVDLASLTIVCWRKLWEWARHGWWLQCLLTYVIDHNQIICSYWLLWAGAVTLSFASFCSFECMPYGVSFVWYPWCYQISILLSSPVTKLSSQLWFPYPPFRHLPMMRSKIYARCWVNLENQQPLNEVNRMSSATFWGLGFCEECTNLSGFGTLIPWEGDLKKANSGIFKRSSKSASLQRVRLRGELMRLCWSWCLDMAWNFQWLIPRRRKLQSSTLIPRERYSDVMAVYVSLGIKQWWRLGASERFCTGWDGCTITRTG